MLIMYWEVVIFSPEQLMKTQRRTIGHVKGKRKTWTNQRVNQRRMSGTEMGKVEPIIMNTPPSTDF